MDSHGEAYLAMRARLVTYFDRKDCASPDDLADEVLNRVGRRLEEEGEIETEAPAKYCFTVARFVFLENLRSPAARQVSIDEITVRASVDDNDEAATREAGLDCLDVCSVLLDPEQRSMIVRYYSGEKAAKIAARKDMAEEFGISLNALAIRAFRVRERLEACVKNCLAKRERN